MWAEPFLPSILWRATVSGKAHEPAAESRFLPCANVLSYEADETPREGTVAVQDAGEGAKSPINKKVILVAAGLLAVLAAGILFAFKFVEDERERNLQEWQIRLGIVADSRSAAIGEWIDQNFTVMRELTENASLQLYMTELEMAEGDKSAVTDEAAQAGYLRNLLVAVAERAGFKAPPSAGEVAANIERVGEAGIALVGPQGQPIAASPSMPPIAGRIREAVAKALNGEPSLIDMYKGATNLPTIGFVLPIYSIQGDETRGIGAVVGVRIVDKGLYDRLKQPGDTSETSETYLVRRTDGTIEYLSPLRDDTPPLDRALSVDTPELAAAYAVETPGGFAVRRDYAGDDVLVTSRKMTSVPGAPWILVRKISAKEALSGTENRLRTMLVVFVLIIVGVGITIIAVWRHGSSVRAAEAAEKFRIAAERFQNMSKFMKVVTDSMPTHIIAVDRETHYTFSNGPAATDAGIEPEDMIGKTMAAVIGPVKSDAYAAINRDVIDNFERAEHMHHFNEGEEDEQVVRSVHIPLRGDRDHPPASLMVLDDLTELTRERRRSEQMLRQLINTLVSVVDRRDPYSADHSARVASVSKAIAGEMGVDAVQVKTVDIAGNLMNLGKIFIPPDVLTKTADLTEEERTMLGRAYLDSADLLKNVVFDGPVVDTIRQMGERIDGNGPLGLSGDDILETANILAVANAFVGMVSARAYRDAMPFEKAAGILLGETGTNFDRRAVSALINYLENRGGRDEWAHFRDKPKDAAE